MFYRLHVIHLLYTEHFEYFMHSIKRELINNCNIHAFRLCSQCEYVTVILLPTELYAAIGQTSRAMLLAKIKMMSLFQSWIQTILAMIVMLTFVVKTYLHSFLITARRNVRTLI